MANPSSSDTFRVFVPAVIDSDSIMKAGDELPPSVVIKGLVSAQVRDSQGELVDQDGLDWNSEFLNTAITNGNGPAGRLTWGHPWRRGINEIGIPSAVNRVQLPDGTPATELVALMMVKGNANGEKAYRYHRDNIAAGMPGLGLSIEGKRTAINPRDQSHCLGARIKSVAADPSPIVEIARLLPFEAIGKAMGMIAKGASLDGNTLDGLGEDAQSIVGLLKAFLAEIQQPDDLRVRIAKAKSSDELKALSFLCDFPDFNMRQALQFVRDPEGFAATIRG